MKQNEIILKLRKDKNLTLEQLASMTGISRNMLWHLEKGNRTGTLETLEKLCSFYNVSLDYITGNSKRYEIIDNFIEDLIECGVLKSGENIPKEIETQILKLVQNKIAKRNEKIN